MTFLPSNGGLHGYQFTFETYLDSSSRNIEADSDHSSSSRDIYDSVSLSESISKYEEEFGRTYHSYRAGSYHYPNDPTETERLDDQYAIAKEVMEGRNYFAPFSRKNSPRKVLDIGTGTGTWAIDMGDEFPEAEIIGTDLSPVQPDLVPPNVRFFVEDSSEEWIYPPNYFNYIHTRYTLGCWSDMKSQIIQRAFDHLKPGGWLECQELNVLPVCDDGSMTDDYKLLQWAQDMDVASRAADRELIIGDDIKQWLEEVGFVDVQQMVLKLPVGGWAKEPRLKHLGMLWQRNLSGGLSGLSVGLLHRFGGKTVEQVEVDLVDVRNSMFDRNVHAYMKIYVVWGRKPDVVS
ncbi:S-adenosyl-L-methionine-dependent methyltransferase [Sordaria sp. MPI-SDFR-AT-0083]|nr:S-adenosyl-L-methionine-dependent methyltransferase [Sordaria sp. MPI-SDFR-AT-0083]